MLWYHLSCFIHQITVWWNKYIRSDSIHLLRDLILLIRDWQVRPCQVNIDVNISQFFNSFSWIYDIKNGKEGLDSITFYNLRYINSVVSKRISQSIYFRSPWFLTSIGFIWLVQRFHLGDSRMKKLLISQDFQDGGRNGRKKAKVWGPFIDWSF